MASWLNRLFGRRQPLQAGMHHYRIDDDLGHTRVHLRVDADGDGLLVVNAAKVLHLNQTATELAKLFLDGASEFEAAEAMARRYRVPKEQIRADFANVQDMVETLRSSTDVCPFTYLDVEEAEPFTTPTTVPYRMDLAVTYRCQNACDHCYNCEPSQREGMEELSTDQWREVLRKLWDLGVPHVCFTGGEATLRDDLPALIEAAEDIGLVTGLLTNARTLADKGYLETLVTAGLDHVQVTLESHRPEIHDAMVGCEGAFEETLQGLRNAIENPVYETTNTTLTQHNVADIEATVDFLADLGLQVFCCNGIIYSGQAENCRHGIPEPELGPILERLHAKAHQRGMRMIWYTPTRYCQLNPIELGLGPKQCTACKFNMCIEPNGDVLPCQSYYRPLGNFLRDEWDAIWDNPQARALRERQELPLAECPECPHLELCRGGCPLYRDDASGLLCVESKSTF